MLALLEAGLPAPAAGVFTRRHGGVSDGSWTSLNLALHVADAPERVLANRDRLRARLGLAALAYAEQVHGTAVAVASSASGQHGCTVGVDALVTAEPGLGLIVLAADCLPVLLADPGAGVVAAVHAGRQGLAGGVLQQALRVMVEHGAAVAGTHAVIGPGVCGACYEVPETVAAQVAELVPGSRAVTRQGTPALDLTAGAERLLTAAGLASVSRLGGCTLEQPQDFYSYRRDGCTGRHAGVVWLSR